MPDTDILGSPDPTLDMDSFETPLGLTDSSICPHQVLPAPHARHTLWRQCPQPNMAESNPHLLPVQPFSSDVRPLYLTGLGLLP